MWSPQSGGAEGLPGTAPLPAPLPRCAMSALAPEFQVSSLALPAPLL